jgi:hypothetical protein
LFQPFNAEQLFTNEFVGTDQNGARWNKGGTIDLFRGTIFNSLSQSNVMVRAANGMAVVTGDPGGLNEVLQSLRDIVERVPEIVVLDWIVRHHESPS